MWNRNKCILQDTSFYTTVSIVYMYTPGCLQLLHRVQHVLTGSSPALKMLMITLSFSFQLREREPVQFSHNGSSALFSIPASHLHPFFSTLSCAFDCTRDNRPLCRTELRQTSTASTQQPNYSPPVQDSKTRERLLPMRFPNSIQLTLKQLVSASFHRVCHKIHPWPRAQM